MQTYIGLLSRCVSFFNIVLFALSYFFFLLYSDFSYLPSGVACNYCWSQVLNARFILPGNGQNNFICIVQDFWLRGCLLMNWQASASSNIFCLSQVLLFAFWGEQGLYEALIQHSRGEEAKQLKYQNSQAVYVGNGLVFSSLPHGLFHPPACTIWLRYP